MYIIETEEGKIKSTAKGVPRHIKEKHLTFADYKNALYNSVNYKHPIAGIRQESHKLYTQVGSKVTMNITVQMKKYLWFTDSHSIPLICLHQSSVMKLLKLDFYFPFEVFSSVWTS